MFNLGYALTIFVTVSTGVAMLAYLPGVRRQAGKPLLKVARPAVYLSALGLAAAAVYLFHLFVSHQFQYDYVYRYSSTDMPMKYVVSAFWGGQEGTFLLWAFFGGLMAVFLRFRSRAYEAPVLFFYLGINLFLMFMLLKASPFSRLATVPPEGNGLNPLLQDPWMTIHPPIMFFGFASLGIPAAYAMAALIKEDWDNWVQRSIPWTTFGVISLGTGLVLGGYWAYSILGWGGFWGWDPVENSSLVPWLVAVSLLHTQVIQLKRGTFKRLNLLLALLPFVLVTYSTFLTRSGVLADFSVHSFTDLGINQFLVAFMVVFLGGGFLLFLFKFRAVPHDKKQAAFFSREYFLFLGALVFGLFGLFVLLGTSAPILTRLWGPASNVQPEFYNRMGLPFAIVIGSMLGLSPFLLWNLGDIRAPLRRMLPALVAALVSAPVLFLAGVRNPGHLLMMVSAILAVLANTHVMVAAVRKNWKAVGAYLAHAGIGLSILGIVASTAYGVAETVVLPRGQEVKAMGYGFTYLGTRKVEGGRKDGYDVAIRTASGSHVVSPTMFFSDMNRGMMKKPAIQSFFARDLYVSPIGLDRDPLMDRIASRFTVEKGDTQVLQGMTVRVEDFRSEPYAAAAGHDHGDPGHASGTDITAVLRFEMDGEVVEVNPVLRRFSDGHTQMVPALIPGAGAQVTLAGVDAAGKRGELSIAPPPMILTPGESAEYRGFEVTLHDYEVETGNRPGGSATAFAHTDVTAAGQTFHARPYVISRPGAEALEVFEAPIGQTGLNLVLAELDPPTGKGHFYIANAPREYFYAETSTKPFIILLWMGTVMTLLGLIIATVRRAGLVDRVAGMVGEGVEEPAPVKNGKRTAA